MRYYTSLLIFSLVVCAHTNAEKLILSKNGENVEITGDVIIDNQEGDVTVTTIGTDKYLIINENQPVILGFYPDSYVAKSGSGNGVGVTWTVVNADTCTARTVQAGRSNWSGSKTAADGKNPSTPEQVTFNSFPATLELVCENDFNSVTEVFTVEEESTQVVTNPKINYFRVNGSSSPTVNLSGNGATAEITWSTTDVTNCEASSTPTLAGWNSNSIGTSGTTNQLSITASTTVTLECDNLPARSINISYTPAGNPACDNISLPPLLTQNPARTTYTDLNEGIPFGVSNSTNAIMDFNINQYAEISGLSTTQNNFYRRLQFVPVPSDRNISFFYTVSISECPGDFNVNSAQCVHTYAATLFPQLPITTNQSEQDSQWCKIEAGKSYYLNIIHDQEPFDNTPGRCGLMSNVTCSVFFSETEGQ